MKYFFILISFFIISSCSIVPTDTPEKTSENTGAIIVDIQLLQNAYSEEMLAHDIYVKIIEKYPELSEVENIVRSEKNHIEQVGKLLDSRNIERPTNYGAYSGAYQVLSDKIATGLTGALEAGIMIEVGDIDHILAAYRQTSDGEIRATLENIGGGSFNHLRAFLIMSTIHGYSVKTDFSRYMTSQDIVSTGPLQYKMTELLESSGLPTSGVGGNQEQGQGQGHGRMNH